MKTLTRSTDDFTWESVPTRAYKEEGTHFQGVTRQVLFDGDPQLPCQWRYFEVAAGGHSTLERHEHLHVVMVIRGRGQALVGHEIHELKCFDLVQIPSLTWHQFRATAGEPLGFLCLVNVDRDRPQLPDRSALEELRADPRIAEFFRV